MHLWSLRHKHHDQPMPSLQYWTLRILPDYKGPGALRRKIGRISGAVRFYTRGAAGSMDKNLDCWLGGNRGFGSGRRRVQSRWEGVFRRTIARTANQFFLFGRGDKIWRQHRVTSTILLLFIYEMDHGVVKSKKMLSIYLASLVLPSPTYFTIDFCIHSKYSSS